MGETWEEEEVAFIEGVEVAFKLFEGVEAETPVVGTAFCWDAPSNNLPVEEDSAVEADTTLFLTTSIVCIGSLEHWSPRSIKLPTVTVCKVFIRAEVRKTDTPGVLSLRETDLPSNEVDIVPRVWVAAVSAGKSDPGELMVELHVCKPGPGNEQEDELRGL